MSDFDDEPEEGAEAIKDEATTEVDDAVDQPVDEAGEAGDDLADDVDDEPAERPSRQRARRDPVDDDWDDDWDDDDLRQGPRRDMTVIYAIIAAVVVIVLAILFTQNDSDNSGGGGNAAPGVTTTTKAPETNWQGPVADAVGEVQKRIGKETGVFIWTDFQGWHVRSTLDEEVTVTITADELKKKGDSGATKPELTQAIAAGDPKKGLDFDTVYSTSMTIEVNVAGTAIPANQIKLGGASGQADANPVSFTKA